MPLPTLAWNGGGKEDKRGSGEQIGDEPFGPVGRQMLRHLKGEGEIEAAIEVKRLAEIGAAEMRGRDAQLILSHPRPVHPERVSDSRCEEGGDPAPRAAADIDD
jgi:hypothetical protein